MNKSVLIVGNFLSASVGNRGVCEELAERLASSHWSVITTSSYLHRGARLFDMLSTAWRSRKRYAVAQVDVYSGSAFFWAEAVCWTLRRAHKPYILTLHGGNLPAFAHSRPRRVSHLLKSASIVTVPSGYLLEQMRPYREDLRLAPNPLDIRLYPFRLRARPAPSLIWLRAFHETYNPTLAVKVAALLVNEFPEVHLTMVGPDKGDGSLQRVEQSINTLEITRHVSLPGSVPKSEVPAAMNQGDIFLNTTNVDNTPVSVIEAMACGLCVVSTDVGGVPYLLEHEHDALLAPPNNPEAMAAAVRRILTEPELAERLSRHARQKAERFDWSAVLPQWETMLAEVAARKPA